jgi:hypothetical protein
MKHILIGGATAACLIVIFLLFTPNYSRRGEIVMIGPGMAGVILSEDKSFWFNREITVMYPTTTGQWFVADFPEGIVQPLPVIKIHP